MYAVDYHSAYEIANRACSKLSSKRPNLNTVNHALLSLTDTLDNRQISVTLDGISATWKDNKDKMVLGNITFNVDKLVCKMTFS